MNVNNSDILNAQQYVLLLVNLDHEFGVAIKDSQNGIAAPYTL